jgi:hypothetical protein
MDANTIVFLWSTEGFVHQDVPGCCHNHCDVLSTRMFLLSMECLSDEMLSIHWNVFLNSRIQYSIFTGMSLLCPPGYCNNHYDILSTMQNLAVIIAMFVHQDVLYCLITGMFCPSEMFYHPLQCFVLWDVGCSCNTLASDIRP